MLVPLEIMKISQLNSSDALLSLAVLSLIYVFLFQACQYMTDIDNTHCTPLPANLFLLPWELPQPNHNDFFKI
jgi:hypothetical protein